MTILHHVDCYSQTITEKQKEITGIICPNDEVVASHSDGTITFWKKKLNFLSHNLGYEKIHNKTLQAHEGSILFMCTCKTMLQIGNNVLPFKFFVTGTSSETKIWSTNWQCIASISETLGMIAYWNDKIVSCTPIRHGHIQLRSLRVSQSEKDIQLDPTINITTTEQLLQKIQQKQLFLHLEVLQSVDFADDPSSILGEMKVQQDYLVFSFTGASNEYFTQYFSLSQFRYLFPNVLGPGAFPAVVPFFIPYKPIEITQQDEDRGSWRCVGKLTCSWPIPVNQGPASCATLWRGHCAAIYPMSKELKMWNTSGECLLKLPVKDISPKMKLYEIHGCLWCVSTEELSQITCWKGNHDAIWY